MHDVSTTAFWVSKVAVFGGLAVILGTLIRTDLATHNSKYTPLRLWASARLRAQYRRLRSPDPAPPGELPELRTMAEALVRNRWWPLFGLGIVLELTGMAITEGSLWRGLTAGGAVLVVAIAGATEVQARAGQAFLRRHPYPEPSAG